MFMISNTQARAFVLDATPKYNSEIRVLRTGRMIDFAILAGTIGAAAAGIFLLIFLAIE